MNQGNIVKAHIIDRVEDINGTIIYDPNNNYSTSKNVEPNKVLDERVAFIIADILKDTLYRTSLLNLLIFQ